MTDWDFYPLKSIGSTNDWCKKEMVNFDPLKITLVTAEEQTEGRGRGGHQWLSPKENLYASYCTFLPRPTPYLHHLSHLLALSVCELFSDLPIRLKWPNDLIIGQKKLAGILCETVQNQNNYFIINGIGINIQHAPLPTSTCLTDHTPQAFDPLTVARKLGEIYLKRYNQLLKQGFAPFIDELKGHLKHYLGKKVAFHEANQLIEGIVSEVHDDGSLTLMLDDQTTRRCYSGDCREALCNHLGIGNHPPGDELSP